MPSSSKNEFILLSTLINILKDKTYYQVFAKSLVTSSDPAKSMLPENEFVKEMFHIFIRENELQIYYNESVISLDLIESEVCKRALQKNNSAKNLEHTKETERNLIWENEIYIKLQDLKKLYANKCIVFPKTLLRECKEGNNRIS